MGITSKWWNSKDYEERKMMALHDNEMRIQQIRIDQQKAKNAHQKFMRETNAQIASCELFIRKTVPAGSEPQLAHTKLPQSGSKGDKV